MRQPLSVWSTSLAAKSHLLGSQTTQQQALHTKCVQGQHDGSKNGESTMLVIMLAGAHGFSTAGADRSSTAPYDLIRHAIKIICLGVRRCLDRLGIENRWHNVSGKENASLPIQIVKGHMFTDVNWLAPHKWKKKDGNSASKYDRF